MEVLQTNKVTCMNCNNNMNIVNSVMLNRIKGHTRDIFLCPKCNLLLTLLAYRSKEKIRTMCLWKTYSPIKNVKM